MAPLDEADRRRCAEARAAFQRAAPSPATWQSEHKDRTGKHGSEVA